MTPKLFSALCSRFHLQGASEQQLRSAISSRLAGVWQALHFAASARGKLRELRRLMVLGGSGGGVVPLVRQLLHKVQLQVGGAAVGALWMFHDSASSRDPACWLHVH